MNNIIDIIAKYKEYLKDFLTKYKKEFSNSFPATFQASAQAPVQSFKNAGPMVKMLIVLALLFCIIFGYLFFKNYMMSQYMKSFANPIKTVSVVKAEYQNWQPKLKAVGSLRAVQGVDVTTDITGLVRTIEFAPGSTVKKGDILVKLGFDVEMAQLHSLQASRDLAQINYQRDKEQYAIKAVSKAVLDSDEANLKSATAQVEQQEAVIAKKIIRAPFDGRLGISNVNLGQYINAGDKVVTLQSLDPIYVDFYLPQQFLSQVSLNQVVTIVSDAFPDLSFKGKITTINPIVDTDTRNVQVEATVENSEQKLLPGMYGQTSIIIGEVQQQVTLPQSAISYNPYGDLVYIVKETGKNKKGEPILTASQAFIKVGDSRGDQIAILEGVKAGDLIVSSGQNKLKNGSQVTINNSVQPADNAVVNAQNN